MRGYFDIFLQDARGLKDEDFLRAQREGRLNSLLKELPVDRELHCSNRVTYAFVIIVLRKLFVGFPDAGYPFTSSYSSGIPLHNITVSYDPSEPAFTDGWSGYNTIHNTPYAVTADAGKRFIGHDIENTQKVNPSGREEVFTRHRFLYLPSQVISNQIRSLSVYWGEYVNDGNDDKAMIARVRMKDSGGQPITLNKSSSQTLLIQYTFSLVAL